MKTSSLRKLASARANGALSCGPVTPQGKARAAQNSVRHGLTARAIVLADEDAAAYDRLRATYFVQFRPRTQYEADLVDNLVAAFWRNRRAICMESAAYDLETEIQRPNVDHEYDNPSPDVRAVLALRGDLRGDGAIVTCSRYSLRFERQYARTLRALLDLLREPPVGPTLAEIESELDLAGAPAACPPQIPKTQNEPNPIFGHQSRSVRPIPRFIAAPATATLGTNANLLTANS